ncbi:MAG: nucleotidyl transferase AbiEii/AbiGii toxin family protein [Planctomycetes bacterium]|nr:nucleotidyl transferase AbiEii/AbiGii toxin family protein [Planctomycetota bacterium]
MHDEILTDRQRNGLEVLRRTGLVSRFYLVGGTATALHLGHRLSIDFDLFTDQEFEPGEIIAQLQSTLPLEVRRQSPATLHSVLNGVQLTFLRYPYPLLDPLLDGPSGLRVAQTRDLLAMKVVAVAQRGTRKDFIDLYFLCRAGRTLEEGLELLPRKYLGAKFDLYHVVNSLQYFTDAEKQPLPAMLAAFSWEECKTFFLESVPPLARKLFGRE